MPAGKIGRTDIDHLALLDEYFHGLPDLLPGCLAINMVHLVQVDVVGLQALERTFHGLADIQRRKQALVRPIAHVSVNFRGHDDFLTPSAALGKPAPDNLLGDALAFLAAIDVGGIKEVDAQLDGFVHDGEGGLLIRLGAEVHRPQAQPGNF